MLPFFTLFRQGTDPHSMGGGAGLEKPKSFLGSKSGPQKFSARFLKYGKQDNAGARIFSSKFLRLLQNIKSLPKTHVRLSLFFQPCVVVALSKQEIMELARCWERGSRFFYAAMRPHIGNFGKSSKILSKCGDLLKQEPDWSPKSGPSFWS